jgi:hypothetical protein
MKIARYVSEMVAGWTNALRSQWRAVIGGGWFGPNPAYDKTKVNLDLARQLYRNDGADTNLGAGFARPIIDRAVEFIGIPDVSSDNPALDAELNANIKKHWKPQIVEMLRNAMRDSYTYVRIYQPYLDDPLTTEEERNAGCLQIIDPERITVIYDPRIPGRIAQAVIVTMVEFPDEVQPDADPPRGAKPQQKEHEIWEVVTPDEHRYYDKTDAKWLDSWAYPNPYGFVTILCCYNEYDSTLSGGQSDLEGPYPFIKAFHEALRQTLQAHKYHSVPKLKFKVADINNFLKNNFPDVIDPATGQPIPGSSIKWQGREVLILGEQDDLGFVEMTNIIADSKMLLEFLIDCIAVSSETPEEMFMRQESSVSSGSDKKIISFEKKIERKRTLFQEPIQMIIKMCLAMTGRTPDRVELLWPEIRTETMLEMSQASQQLGMALEVFLERKLISDNTARETISMLRIFRKMKDPLTEATDAEGNFLLATQQQDAQLQLAKVALKNGSSTSNGNGNGNGSRVAGGRGAGGGANE